jgi:hypothetical protein
MALSREVVRRAYERDRLADGAIAAWPVPVLIALAAAMHGHAGAGAVIAGVALAAVLVVARWRGTSWWRGARAGLIAGLLPLIVPATVLAARGKVHCAGCTPSVGDALACAMICIGASLVAGIAVGLRGARDPAPRRYIAAALAAAALVGLIACGVVGVGGSLGIVAGLAIGGVPAAVLARRPT